MAKHKDQRPWVQSQPQREEGGAVADVADFKFEAGKALDAGKATPPGVYAVHLAGCPRRRIDTGLPAGPQAEKAAADTYLAWLRLVRRPGVEPTLQLVES